MSRPPRNHDAHSPSLTNALTPFGVIDFVDNHCLQAAAPALHPLQHAAGVVGGPPAYLDAHGIRYVPVASLESGAPEELAAPALKAEPPPRAAVTQHDLESRVDNRIRQFMRESSDPGRLSSGYRGSGVEVYERPRSALESDADGELDMTDYRKLRAEIEATAPSARSRAQPAKLSHTSAGRVGKARRELERDKIDF